MLARLAQLRRDGVERFYADASHDKVTIFPELLVPPPLSKLQTFGLAPEFARKHDRLTGVFPSSGYYYFDNHYVSRAGTVLDEQRRIKYASDLITSYWMWFLSKIIVQDIFGEIPSDNLVLASTTIGYFLKGEMEASKNIDDDTVIVNLVKPGASVYGHWLLDVFPSVWQFMRCREARDGIGPVKYMLTANAPSWAIQYLKLAFDLDEKDLIFFDDMADVVKVRRMLVPSLLRVGSLISPRMNGVVDHILAKVRPLSGHKALPRRVFISRDNYAKRNRRILLAHKATEAVFSEYGCAAIQPEAMSWPDQIALFSNAELVAGEFGSGLHNTLFGGPDLTCMVLLHSKHNWNQSAIAALRRQRVAYVAPTTQRPTGLAKGVTYSFDSSMLRSALAEIVDESGLSPSTRELPGDACNAAAENRDPTTRDLDVEAASGPGAVSPDRQANTETTYVDRRPALLTIATDGYEALWQFCIESHRAYANRHGIEYVLRTVKRPPYDGRWTRIAHATFLLAAGRDVMMIDADAQITGSTPHFCEILDAHPDKDIFYVKDDSERPKSGVMLLRGGRDSVAHAFLRQCLAHRTAPIPGGHSAPQEGERGHVSHFLQKAEFAPRAMTLDPIWNHTTWSRFAGAHVRHYTDELRASLWHADTLTRLSQKMPPRPGEDLSFREAASTYFGQRSALLTALRADTEKFFQFKGHVLAMERPGHQFLDLEDNADAESWLRRYEFAANFLDASTCEVIARIVKPGMNVVTKGAASGHIVRAALQATAGDGRLVAIDSDHNIDVLRNNSQPVHTVENAVANDPIWTIDKICDERSLSVVHFMYIDANGWETDAIRGASVRIQSSTNIRMIVRIDPAKNRVRGLEPKSIVEVAFQLGLVARRINRDFSLAPAGPVDPEHAYHYLFVRPTYWRLLKRALILPQIHHHRDAPLMSKAAI
jgi:capsular polysaccharide biosynthesis protein